VGDWTGDVFDLFKTMPVDLRHMETEGLDLDTFPEARIDGPYGAATEEVCGEKNRNSIWKIHDRQALSPSPTSSHPQHTAPNP